MANTNTSRQPTSEELDQLTHYLFRQWQPDYTLKAVREIVDTLYIAVFDDYLTTSPGYAGKLMTVISQDDPGFSDGFLWHRGQIKRVERTRNI